MTASTTAAARIGSPATIRVADRRTTVRLLGHQLRYELRTMRRNPTLIGFTIGMPLVMMLIFAELMGNEDLGAIGVLYKEYLAPRMVVLAILTSSFVSLAISVALRRGNGELKRVRSTPMPAGVVLAALGITTAALSLVSATWVLVTSWWVFAIPPPALAPTVLVLVAGVRDRRRPGHGDGDVHPPTRQRHRRQQRRPVAGRVHLGHLHRRRHRLGPRPHRGRAPGPPPERRRPVRVACRRRHRSPGGTWASSCSGASLPPPSPCTASSGSPTRRTERARSRCPAAYVRAMATIRPATDADVPAITEIANALIATTSYEWTETPHTVAERPSLAGGPAGRDRPVLVADDGRRGGRGPPTASSATRRSGRATGSPSSTRSTSPRATGERAPAAG